MKEEKWEQLELPFVDVPTAKATATPPVRKEVERINDCWKEFAIRKDGTYVCIVCGKVYSTLVDYRDHLRMDTGGIR